MFTNLAIQQLDAADRSHLRIPRLRWRTEAQRMGVSPTSPKNRECNMVQQWGWNIFLWEFYELSISDKKIFLLEVWSGSQSGGVVEAKKHKGAWK